MKVRPFGVAIEEEELEKLKEIEEKLATRSRNEAIRHAINIAYAVISKEKLNNEVVKNEKH